MVARRSSCVLRPETKPNWRMRSNSGVPERSKPPLVSTSRNRSASLSPSWPSRSNTKRSKFEALEMSMLGLDVWYVCAEVRTR
ncbi:hypothetical protein D3C85_1263650 [compost metagenome]